VRVGSWSADHGRDHDAGHHRRAVEVHRGRQRQGNGRGGDGHGALNGHAPPSASWTTTPRPPPQQDRPGHPGDRRRPLRHRQGRRPGWVLSLVDPQARHGHKTSAHGFDGYKGHIAADPDSEIITAAEVGPATQATRRWRQRCWPTWRGGAWWRCSRWRRRPLPVGGTPRTGSPSTWTLRRSPAPPGSPWRSSRAVPGRAGPLRPRLRRLPARQRVHQQPRRSHDQLHPHQALLTRARQRPAGSRLTGRLPRAPPHRGTQTRAPAPPPAWRAARPRARAAAGRAGLAAAGRRGQPRPPHRARRALPTRWVGAGTGVDQTRNRSRIPPPTGRARPPSPTTSPGDQDQSFSTPIGHQRPRNVVDGLAGCLLPPVAGYAGRSPRYRCSELLAWLRRDRK
jgi:hypothetical protein